MLKRKLKELNKDFGCISERVCKARASLDNVQSRLDLNPLLDNDFQPEEREKARNLRQLSWAKESLVKQKSKVHWLKKGDQNTRYFFKSINSWRNKNSIQGILLQDGSVTFGKDITNGEFVRYFKSILTSPI